MFEGSLDFLHILKIQTHTEIPSLSDGYKKHHRKLLDSRTKSRMPKTSAAIGDS